jgi:hypothetical protein
MYVESNVKLIYFILTPPVRMGVQVHNFNLYSNVSGIGCVATRSISYTFGFIINDNCLAIFFIYRAK